MQLKQRWAERIGRTGVGVGVGPGPGPTNTTLMAGSMACFMAVGLLKQRRKPSFSVFFYFPVFIYLIFTC